MFQGLSYAGIWCAAPSVSKDKEALCRSIVLSLPTGRDLNVQVQYLDYGHKDSIPFGMLRELPEIFRKMPPLAPHIFSVAGMEEMGLSPTPDLHEWFYQFTANKKFRLRVVPSDPTSFLQRCHLLLEGVNVLDILRNKVLPDLINYDYPCLSPGEECRVVISYVHTEDTLPWFFYVQRDDIVDEVEALSGVNTAYCSSATTKVGLNVDAPVFVPFKGSCWFRGRALGMEESGEVQIHYVDYGNRDIVQRTQVSEVRPDLVTRLPAAAISCRLQFADTLQDGGSLFAEVTEGKVLLMKVVQQLDSGEHLVRMFDTSMFPAKDLSFELLSLAQGRQPLPSSNVAGGLLPPTGKHRASGVRHQSTVK
jgi:hypothetical protein